jgi:hypothetical protein
MGDLSFGLTFLGLTAVLVGCGNGGSSAGADSGAHGGACSSSVGGCASSSGGTTSIGGGGATSGGTAGAGANAGAGGAAGSSGLPCGVAPPDSGVLARFEVAGEFFNAWITDVTGISGAIDLWQGRSTASIPNGALVCEPADYNCGYGWHLDPAQLQFADFTIEVCDGTPSYVDGNCATFGSNYCPWSAVLVGLWDCSTPGCPPVPK